jgi:predicted ATPase
MRCLARLNRHTAALQQYDQLAQTLQAELKIDPLPETRALADAIRAELALLQLTPACASFVGSGAERAQALQAVEALIANQGGALAIEGPPGIGKSRLWEEIAAGAKWRGVTVVSGRAAEHSAESPFAPLSEVLAQALQGPRTAQIELLLPAETVAAVGELYPPWRDRSAPIDLPPDQARRRFQHAVIKVWQALASLAPHAILLDDVQWATAALWETLDALLAEIRVSSSLADDPSLRGALSATKQSPAFETEIASRQNARNDAAFGDQLGQRSRSQRLLIGLAYRRPEIEHSAGWPTLQRRERNGQLQTISLKPLSVSEVTELLPPNQRSQAETIAALSGGNPFYVTQMQLALDEGYALDQQPVLTRAAALPRRFWATRFHFAAGQRFANYRRLNWRRPPSSWLCMASFKPTRAVIASRMI